LSWSHHNIQMQMWNFKKLNLGECKDLVLSMPMNNDYFEILGKCKKYQTFHCPHLEFQEILAFFMCEISHCCKTICFYSCRFNDFFKIIKTQKRSYFFAIFLHFVQVGSQKYVRMFRFFSSLILLRSKFDQIGLWTITTSTTPQTSKIK
jgi:hypothetical protein